MPQAVVLDLGLFVDPRETALIGRERGEAVRRKIAESGLSLDSIIDSGNIITTQVPSKVVTINRSFFLGLFEILVKRLGKDRFLEVFQFETTPYIKEKIRESVSYALLEASQEDILKYRSNR